MYFVYMKDSFWKHSFFFLLRVVKSEKFMFQLELHFSTDFIRSFYRVTSTSENSLLSQCGQPLVSLPENCFYNEFLDFLTCTLHALPNHFILFEGKKKIMTRCITFSSSLYSYSESIYHIGIGNVSLLVQTQYLGCWILTRPKEFMSIIM